MSVALLTASDVDPGKLDSFLSRMYSPAKSLFLRQYGDWWHGGTRNRWALLDDGNVVGYCAIIPSRIYLQGKSVNAIWWMDLVIDPAFRGKGYQTLFDREMRKLADLKLGFPNKFAASIHKRHKWGVREDLQVRVLPLQPLHMRAVRNAKGWKGIILRLFTRFASPFFTLLNSLLGFFYKLDNAFQLEKFDAALLSGIFTRFKEGQVITTVRDAAYFQWRYGDAPYFGELAFYLAGPRDAPTHYLIARHVPAKGMDFPVTRILDIYGDLTNRKYLIELFRLAILDAMKNQSVQVMMMATLPSLQDAAIRAGFWVSGRARFCWLSESADIMGQFALPGYWVLADSDNDEPD